MKQFKLVVYLLSLCLITQASIASSNSIVSFDLSAINNHNIGEDIEYYSLEDQTTSLPARLNQLEQWLTTLNPHTVTNTSGDKYLAVFELFNDTQRSDWFVYPYGSVVQNIEITGFGHGRADESIKTGHGLNNQQDFHYGGKVQILPGQRKSFVIVFESDYFFAPIKILVRPQEQSERLFHIENVLLLLSLGVCLALGLYNLFLFFSTRNIQYLSYALATFSYALGWAAVFGLPEYVGLARSDGWLMPIFIVGAIFSSLFNIQFLQLKESAPKTASAFRLIALLGIISLPFAFYDSGFGLYLASLITSAVCILGIYIGVRRWVNGYLPAKYFVLALVSVVLPNMVGNLMNFGVLPGINVNIYLLGLIGNSLDALLLAFALASQVRILTLQNRELTATLENTVQERTIKLREANYQLEQTNSELLEANKAKGRFLATMSHEIRTPLTSIIGYADGILLGDIDKAEQDRVIRIIEQNGNHLLRVINDILDISKIEANKLEFESIPTSLFSILAQIESVVGKRARDKGLAFHLEYEYPLPSQISTDPTRLKQILFNLTNNAIKFTEQGYIGLSVKVVDNQLQIRVKDSGEGISTQEQEKLFQPFTQADSSINRRFGGTGLGLSISQRLAHGLGGDISVQSSPRRGSTFTLHINLVVVVDSPWINNVGEIWQSTPTKSVLPAALPNFVGNKVLLADDHPNNRELIAILLKRMNIEVVEVENGKQALNSIFYQNFDLILLDIHMPQMDGTEALKQIRAEGNITPVIALTANNMKHEIEHYMRLGFSDHLAKPVSRHLFVSKLSFYLTKHGELDNPLQQGDMLKLINDYQLDLQDQVTNLQKALDQGDLTVISEIAHRIRGSAGAFGFDILGQKFADIEHCALQDDEIAVTYELPKILSLAKQCIDLPGVEIAKGIVNHHNSVEQFLRAIVSLLDHSQQTLEDLTAALDNNEVNSAIVHLYKFFPSCYDCALVQSEVAFKTLDNIIKQGTVNRQEYTPQINIITAHLEQLRSAIHPNLLDEI